MPESNPDLIKIMVDGTIPAWLTGVWQRLSFETEDGFRDTTTQVIYLQTPSCYGDLRIPGDRPNVRDKTSVHDLTSAEMLALSEQQGFAGISVVRENVCRWYRYIDYQPPTGLRDIGALHWEGEILIEEGIDAPYREEWQRIDDGNGDFTALILPSPTSVLDGDGGRWEASIVTAGDWFVYARNRETMLTSANSLTTLVAKETDNAQQQGLLNCEIAVGRCASGQVPWEIQHSTLPWREGQGLWEGSSLAIALADGYLFQTLDTPELTMHQWVIREWGTGKAFGME